ncbi:MAG: phenylalanine--tRNA ligase subunit alpha [Gemmatimonadaceae bacterium]|jgi:phenylalanyl-tRNA synthetase alpha chain|nr:phenylalanine--tRNA ligase subunit alpha [Gemmatimonadaceae bacterium]
MTLDEFLARAAELERDGLARIADAHDAAALDDARITLLGRKQGALTALMSALPTLPPEARRDAGAASNRVKGALEQALDARLAALRAAAAPSWRPLDPTMPARATWRGALHPVTLVIDEIAAIFRELGFTIALGPEAETEWYNFGALNFPPDHPAMELHDTLYLGDDTLLRTHTSPVQVRALQAIAPPVRILAPGTVYRRDFFDATHAPAFAQVEGMAVDEGISFADLKATLSEFARRFYGRTRRVRFGPSYFPFVEPGAQMDVEVDLGDGKGLRWVEILGCGLMHPRVLEAAGLDSERYTGWAFGMGPARIAMSRHGINDIRLLYDSDVRVLAQFAP